MMISLGRANWIRLVVWLALGLLVYFFYSVRHSKVQALPSSTQGM
jgi:APA family basic amino acid/polyamine antiporter